MIRLEDDFEAAFSGCKVVKVEDSQLLRIYNPLKREPTLIFLRNGSPILYPPSDPDSAEEIYQFFNENREPIIKELDDSNFEHLTQASTGSTTGNWLVFFYDNACVDCTRLTAIIEATAAKLKFSYTNVARVSMTKGFQTAKRFKVEKAPTFLLIRKGKFYRYNLKNYEVDSLVGFAAKTFQNFGAESIKPQASPFENLIDMIVQKLKQLQLSSYREIVLSKVNDNPIPILIVATLLVLYVLSKLFRGSKKTESVKEDNKKKSSKKEK